MKRVHKWNLRDFRQKKLTSRVVKKTKGIRKPKAATKEEAEEQNKEIKAA